MLRSFGVINATGGVVVGQRNAVLFHHGIGVGDGGQQALGVRMNRVGENLLLRAGFHHVAQMQHADAVGYILRALNGEQPQRTTIYTVAIKDLECNEADIWTSAFSTREAAENFKVEVEAKLAEYGITTSQVCLDSGYLDDDMYLGWLDDRYGSDDEMDETTDC